MCVQGSVLTSTEFSSPLKQSALSVEQRSIKKPLIMALYSLLLDVNFNLQLLIQFPCSRVAGSAPKGQDNEGRGTKSPQAGTWGSVERLPGDLPSFLCVYIGHLIVQMESFKHYWRRE